MVQYARGDLQVKKRLSDLVLVFVVIAIQGKDGYLLFQAENSKAALARLSEQVADLSSEDAAGKKAATVAVAGTKKARNDRDEISCADRCLSNNVLPDMMLICSTILWR